MNRPIYEHKQTITKEEEFKKVIEEATGHKLVKMPRAYEVDFAMLDGPDYVGCAELKCRNYTSTAFKSLILSLHKLDALKRWRRYGSASLYVRFIDTDLVFPIADDLTLDIRFAGRTDRGDWQDSEPCIHIPIDLMDSVVSEVDGELPF